MDVPINSIERIETARLIGRRIGPDDFQLLCELLQNPRVAATLGGVRSDDEVREFLAKNLEQWLRHGYGRWMWHSKADGRFVGRGGLLNIELDSHQEVEVGYALVPAFWRQGLATEIARASIEVAFNKLEISNLACFTEPTNLASRRVMEKAGFDYERDFLWQNLPHLLYRLRR